MPRTLQPRSTRRSSGLWKADWGRVCRLLSAISSSSERYISLGKIAGIAVIARHRRHRRLHVTCRFFLQSRAGARDPYENQSGWVLMLYLEGYGSLAVARDFRKRPMSA